MPKSPSKVGVIKNITIYSVFLVIIWSSYRFLFQLPDTIEELIVKPVVWLIPILILVHNEGLGIRSIGVTFRNLFSSVYLSIGLGSIFVIEAVLTNFVKYGHLNFAANLGGASFLATLGLSFATAISEETAFRGYIFSRLMFVSGNELIANLIQAGIWTIVHIPIAFFVFRYTLSQGIVYLILTAIFGIGSAFIFARTRNIAGSILLHVLWEWPIILFR